MLVELLIALLGSGLKAIEGYGAGYVPGPRTFGTPAYIGNLLLTRFLLAFEIASFLLLIAAVGGVVLARRRGGLGEESHERARPAGPRATAGHRHDGRGGRRPAVRGHARERGRRGGGAPQRRRREPLQPVAVGGSQGERRPRRGPETEEGGW